MRASLAVFALLPVLALPARAQEPAAPYAADFTISTSVARADWPSAPTSVFALALPANDHPVEPLRWFRGRHRGPRKVRPAVETMPLGPERARILLRSLTIPGWGQATLGHRHAAAVFGIAEAGVWTAFTSFRIQELLRRQDYERTARLFAGIDLKGRDDEYRRIVGAFPNSDDYNLYVVARDAANQFLTDPYHPDIAGYHAYVAAHSISGADGWHWTDESSFLRYRSQRKGTQRASMRANTALGIAIANRIVSALHATRLAGHAPAAAPTGTSWRFELSPPDPADPLAFRAALSANF